MEYMSRHTTFEKQFRLIVNNFVTLTSFLYNTLRSLKNMNKPFAFLLLNCWLTFPFYFHAQVVINEYSAANVSNHLDGFGEYEDWFELYNGTGNAIDLTGWYLSDRATNPLKFVIPSGTIPANGRIMVYCSGRAATLGGAIHTSFKLTQTQPENIVLSDAAGTLVDELTLVPCQSNHSRGRTSDGASTWSLFTTPTPSAPNSSPQNEYAQKPIFDVPSGIVAGPTSVSLAVTQPGLTIRYTLDGTTPTAASLAYSGPIAVNTNTVIRARSFTSDANTPPSFVETNTYLVGVSHTVPILCLSGDEVKDLANDIAPNAFSDNFDGTIEYFSAQGSLIDEGAGFYNKHGNDSWAYPQRGLDFVMRDQYGYNHAIHHVIYRGKNRDEFSRIMLKAGASDNYPFESGGAHIRDAYVQSLSQVNKLKLDERSYEPCVVYIDGEYWGVYEMREKVDDNDFLEHYNDQKELYSNSPLNVQFLKTWGGTWTEYGGPQAQTDWDNLLNYINTNDMSVAANFNYVDSLFNWESLIDYFVLNSYIVSQDWLNWNTGWWRGLNPAGDKKRWRYILWDMDACFGHYVNFTGIPDTGPTADPCNAENLPDPGGQGHTQIMTRLMDNDIFRQYYVSRYIDLSNTAFKCENMIQHLDSLVALIEPEMPQHITRWGGSIAEWQANVQAIRDFINARCANLSEGLMDCYDVTGPYEITFDVEPVGGGEIQANSIVLEEYPFTGTYYGNIDLLLTATPAAGYNFLYWEIVDTIDPHSDSAYVKVILTQPQTIIAHFGFPGEEPPANYEGVFIPTGFSPNGDGQNDVLQLFVGNDVAEISFQLFNRWGEMVFETNSPSVMWDGYYKGTLLNSGVFVYQIDIRFANGSREKRAGNITLVR
jgi:gliding motility-associated-like protein